MNNLLEKINAYIESYKKPPTGREVEGTIELLEELSECIKAYRWIPVSERLPEEKMNPVTNDWCVYPVTYRNGSVTDTRYYAFGNGHWWHGPQTMDDKVLAWMPLPEPYKEEG